MTTNNWREELDKTFIDIETGKVNEIFTHVDIKHFIQSLLNAQREEIIDVIQNHKDDSDCCYDNPCIEEIINKIKEIC